MRETLKSELSSNVKSAMSMPTFAVWAAAVAITVMTGPFNTYEDLGLVNRTLFWGLVVSVSVLIGYISRALAMSIVGDKHPFRFDLLASVAMAMLITPAIWGIGRMFEPMFMFNEATITRIFLFAMAFSTIIFTVRRILPGIEPYPYDFAQHDDSFTTDRLPRLRRRLPEAIRGDILRVSAKDHHVEIATALGVSSLRMRFNDAIAEMDPVEGHCAHRSHWIARSAIVDIDRETSQKVWIILRNGDRVPVSRKYRPGLEDAGIL